MKKEIKEILELYKDDDVEYYNAYSRLSVEEILDYITNLQEENEELKKRDKSRNVFKEFTTNKYKQRIDRAIDYIKNNWYSKNTRDIERMVSFGDWRIDLLNILQGEDTKESEVN